MQEVQRRQTIRAFWKAVLAQEREELSAYFTPDAVIRWHCTNEQFTVDEYIRANCDYPGKWDGTIERIDRSAAGIRLLYRKRNISHAGTSKTFFCQPRFSLRINSCQADQSLIKQEKKA